VARFDLSGGPFSIFLSRYVRNHTQDFAVTGILPGSGMSSKADEYRAQADECDKCADKTHDRDVRDQYRELARQWREMAKQAERRTW